MTTPIRLIAPILFLLALPLTLSAQFSLIQQIPGQVDDEWELNGYQGIEAANGDVVVFIVKNGEITQFPPPPPRGLSICSESLHVTSDTEWEFYTADCVFGFGEASVVSRRVTTDGGSTWTEETQSFTAASPGFGGTLGSVVDHDLFPLVAA